MVTKEEALAACGLTKNEIKVYISLLKIGSGTAMDITKASGVHRVNVYDTIERLREKGLISTIVQTGNKRIFEAIHPKQIVDLMKEKEELISLAMPLLEADYRIRNERQQVYHFFGPEGVMRAYHMMLEQKQTIYAIGGSGLNRKYLAHRHEIWNRERLSKGIKGKGIYYEFTKGDKDRGWIDPTMEIRYIPDKFRTLGMVDICGNLVVNLLPIQDNIMAIVIENQVLADTYRQFFNYMWKFAKK